MNSGCSKLLCSLVLAGLTLSVAATATAQQPPSKRGRAIQFSETRSDVVSSNVNELRTKKTSLKQLEQELKKPFELLNPVADPANRLTAPPLRHTAPPARTKQMKELLEKRNEWIFLEAEDYYGSGLTPEEMLNLPEYGPNGELKKRKTALERYYDNLDKAQADARVAATNRARADEMFGTRPKDEETEDPQKFGFANEPSSFNPGLGNNERAGKSLAPGERPTFSLAAPEAFPNRGFADAFGFGRSEPIEPGSDRSRSVEARNQEFKKLLETGSSPPVHQDAGALNSFISPPFSTPSLLKSGNLGTLPGAGVSSTLPPNPTSLSPSPILPSVAVSPALPAWQTTPAPVEQPRKVLPPPTFQIPQRKF